MSPEESNEAHHAEPTTRPDFVDIELEPLNVWRVFGLTLLLSIPISLLMVGVALIAIRMVGPQPTPPKGLIYVPFAFIALFIPSLILLTKWRERRARCSG